GIAAGTPDGPRSHDTALRRSGERRGRMISCTDFIAEMGDYLDGAVAAELRQHLESHLAHCQTCQVIYDSTRKTLQVVTESGSFDLPDAAVKPIADKIMTRIRQGLPPDPHMS